MEECKRSMHSRWCMPLMLCLQPYWPGFLRRFYDVLRLAVAREIRCVRESNEYFSNVTTNAHNIRLPPS